MHFSTTIATTVFAISLSAAILFPPECIIPPQIFHSLDQSFTLSILQPSLIIGGPFAWLPLQLTPVTPTKQTSSKLVNNKAQSKIAPSKFVLKNRKLIAHGFPAKSLPIAETLPRPLAPVVFGGTAILADNVKFFAGYSCDGNNELYLGLFADPSMLNPGDQ